MSLSIVSDSSYTGSGVAGSTGGPSAAFLEIPDTARVGDLIVAWGAAQYSTTSPTSALPPYTSITFSAGSPNTAIINFGSVFHNLVVGDTIVGGGFPAGPLSPYNDHWTVIAETDISGTHVATIHMGSVGAANAAGGAGGSFTKFTSYLWPLRIIQSATGSSAGGNHATIVYDAPHGFAVGEWLLAADFATAGWNGVWQVTTVSLDGKTLTFNTPSLLANAVLGTSWPLDNWASGVFRAAHTIGMGRKQPTGSLWGQMQLDAPPEVAGDRGWRRNAFSSGIVSMTSVYYRYVTADDVAARWVAWFWGSAFGSVAGGANPQGTVNIHMFLLRGDVGGIVGRAFTVPASSATPDQGIDPRPVSPDVDGLILAFSIGWSATSTTASDPAGWLRTCWRSFSGHGLRYVGYAHVYKAGDPPYTMPTGAPPFEAGWDTLWIRATGLDPGSADITHVGVMS